MTLAAAWFDPPNFVFAAADSRIGHTGGVLTEHGPKLLSLTMTCREGGPSGFFDKVVHHSVFGFAYAGATLPALSTHALANTVCARLIGNPGRPSPGLHDLAFMVGHIGAGYMREVGALSGANALFECIVFGWCPVLARFRAIVLRPDLDHSPLKVKVEPVEMTDASSIAVIGVGVEKFKKLVCEHKAAGSRAPNIALEVMIGAEDEPRVGGTIQKGYCNQLGFRPVGTPRRIEGIPNVTTTVLGYDVDAEFPAVGDYVFSMEGLF